MAEAYKRNPDVATFILSWGVPRWVGNGSYFSDENIAYQVGYAKCVAQTLNNNNHPSYIGIWSACEEAAAAAPLSLRPAAASFGLSAT